MNSLVCAWALLLGAASASLVTTGLSLHTCREGVGLAPILRLRDSRAAQNEISCRDGNLFSERAISSDLASMLVQFQATLRPLGKGIARQGYSLRGLFFQDTHIVLTGVCLTDIAPTARSSLDSARMPRNMCAGVDVPSNTGSPRLDPFLDETSNVHFGWQIRNPPQPSNAAMMATLSGTTAACNFYGAAATSAAGDLSLNGMNMGMFTRMPGAAMGNMLGLAEMTGIADYVGLAQIDTAITGGCAFAQANAMGNFFMQAVNDGPLIQRYGSLTGVLQTWVAPGLSSIFATTMMLNAHQPFTKGGAGMSGGNVRGVMSYAGFQVGHSGAIGFQVSCEAAARDETKWLTITFMGGDAVATPATQDWDYNPPELTLMGMVDVPQNSIDSQVGIRFTCQNEATDTPTPPLYPRAPAPAPSDAPYPLSAGAKNTVVVTAIECARLCQNVNRQQELIAKVGQVALQNGNVGANTRVTCEQSAQCSEHADIAALLPVRRGLKQATSVAWLQTVVIVTRELATAQWIVNQIRQGLLAPFISPFAALSIRVFDRNQVEFPQVVPPPSASSPIAIWPSPLAEWTGSCQVYGNCRAGGCASACTSDVIQKVSAFGTAVTIACLCNACGLVVGQVGASTQYFFQTFDCASSSSQTAANECCRNVMQDAVCWALANEELSVSDAAFIASGRWTYRPPSIGVVGPAGIRNDGPFRCPDSSSSNKGLLGLLGLLGIIPIVLCLLCLLLCLLRRKKREGDVHFATFDPHTMPVGMGPCPTVPGL